MAYIVEKNGERFTLNTEVQKDAFVSEGWTEVLPSASNAPKKEPVKRTTTRTAKNNRG